MYSSNQLWDLWDGSMYHVYEENEYWSAIVSTVFLIYRKTSKSSRTSVSNKIVDNSDVVGNRLSALLQLHLHSKLNTWLQWIGQRPLPEETINI